jgi:hypothetical protein
VVEVEEYFCCEVGGRVENEGSKCWGSAISNLMITEEFKTVDVV